MITAIFVIVLLSLVLSVASIVLSVAATRRGRPRYPSTVRARRERKR